MDTLVVLPRPPPTQLDAFAYAEILMEPMREQAEATTSICSRAAIRARRSARSTPRACWAVTTASGC